MYGVRVLEELSKLGIETFVVISRAARTVMKEEGIEEGVVESMASHLYEENDLAAPP